MAVYRTIAALGVPRSVYYAWKSRDDLQDRTAQPCRAYEALPEERAAICDFALQYLKDRVSQAHLDDGRCGRGRVGESTVYRVLSDADLLPAGSDRRCRAANITLTERAESTVAYRRHVRVGGRTIYFLVSFVDAYSRYIVHHKLLMSLDGKSVALELQAALDAATGPQTSRRARSRQRVRQSRRRGGHQNAQPKERLKNWV